MPVGIDRDNRCHGVQLRGMSIMSDIRGTHSTKPASDLSPHLEMGQLAAYNDSKKGRICCYKFSRKVFQVQSYALVLF